MLMRLLYITSYYKPAYVYGGPVRSISQMCQALAGLGAHVTVLTTDANGARRLDVPLGEPVSLGGVEVSYFPIVPVPPRSFFYSPAQVRACREWIPQSDIVILETLWTHPMRAAVQACRRAQVPYVVPLRGQLMPWALAQKALKKKLYLALFARRYLNHAAALHCTDPAEAEAARALGITAQAIVVPNGIDAARLARLPERGMLRSRLGIAPGAPLLLFLGRLNRIKRPDIAISTLAALHIVHPEAALVIAGPDEQGMGPGLKDQARAMGCADRVHFTGLLQGEEMQSAWADADLLVMPSSVQESFGMSAVEAMAAGVPVLVSQGVPVGQWAAQAGAGRQVDCTPEAFAQAAREMLADPNRLREMGQRGQALVRRRFDLPVVARQMLAELEAIARTGRPLPETSAGGVLQPMLDS